MAKHQTFQSTDADFVLIYHPEGTVELQDAKGNQVWHSNSDDDFADEFEGDFFSDEDTDEILDYLNDAGFIDLDEDEIDIVENDLVDESNVIDADFTVVKKGTRQ